MLVTLAIGIFSCAIMVIFANEFGSLFKKIFAIRGAKLFLPLIGASLVAVLYEPWLLMSLLYLKETLFAIIKLLASIFPFHFGAFSIAAVAVIMILTVFPVYVLNIISIRKTHFSFAWAQILNALLWLFFMILLTVSLAEM